MILMVIETNRQAGAEFDDTPPFDSDEQRNEEDADEESDGKEDDQGVD